MSRSAVALTALVALLVADRARGDEEPVARPAAVRGAYVVRLHPATEPFAEVVVEGDGRAVVVRFEPLSDGAGPPAIDAVALRMDVAGDVVERPLERAGDAEGDVSTWRTTAPLPEEFESFDDVSGTLVVFVGGVEYRGVVDASASPVADRKQATGRAESPSTSFLVGLLVVYCGLIVASSLIGGWLPSWIALTHNRMQAMISLVGGLMLGIGLFHMLPHAAAELGSLDRAMGWTMAGLLAMFVLIRAFHFHQHGPVELPKRVGEVVRHPVQTASIHDHDHDHDGGGDHAHDRNGHHRHGGSHRLSWVGVMIGLSVHTLIDGVALAASVRAEAARGSALSLFGLGTFLAVLLHKPLDAISITSLMRVGGWSASARNLVNLAYASMCPLGAFLFFSGGWLTGSPQHLFVGAALAFAAGVFVCISLGDLLPEMEFHSHNRIPLTVMLLLGIAIAWTIGLLEPDHAHGLPGVHSH